MGDAAGVGPEIVMKALAQPGVHARCRPFVVGDAVRLAEAAHITGVKLALRFIATPEEARFEAATVDVLDLKLIPPGMPRSARYRRRRAMPLMNMSGPRRRWRWKDG